MAYDPGYTKANIGYDTNKVLKTIAKERKKYVYQIIDEVMREKFPEYFHQFGC